MAQVVCADVGHVLIQNVFRCAVLHEGFQHGFLPRRLNARGQLAVREGSCAAFAELDVAFRIKYPLGAHGIHVLHPGFHRLATLQQNRIGAAPGKGQCSKQSCRACAYHHRPLRKGRSWQGFCRFGHNLFRRALLHVTKQFLLPFHLHIHGHDKVNISLVTGIDGLAVDGHGAQSACRNAKPAQYQLYQLLITGRKGKVQVAYSKHAYSSNRV